MATGFELISDLHKDARGFRPGATFMEAFNASTDAEKQVTWDYLCDELTRRMRDEAMMELEAQREFETRIEGMVADYGIDRGTAIRWDMDAFEVDIDGALKYHGSAAQEIEYYLFRNGLACQMFRMYVAEILKALGIQSHTED